MLALLVVLDWQLHHVWNDEPLPTFVYILHIVIGQTSALSCSMSKRCVPECVQALFRFKPRTCDEVLNLLWEIYCAMSQEHIGSTLSATTVSRKAWTWVVVVQGHYHPHNTACNVILCILSVSRSVLFPCLSRKDLFTSLSIVAVTVFTDFRIILWIS